MKVFFHIRPIETPSVPPERRYDVSRLAIANCYRLVVRHGYLDEVITPDLASLIHEKIRESILQRARGDESVAAPPTSTTTRLAPVEYGESAVFHLRNNQRTVPVSNNSGERIALSSSPTATRLEALEKAFQHEVFYIIGKEQMHIKKNTNIFRKGLLHTFLFIRENTRNKIANLKVQQDRVIEIGFIKDV
jgi:KUP system potassium uptake protein